jgi:hypothetical protein
LAPINHLTVAEKPQSPRESALGENKERAGQQHYALETAFAHGPQAHQRAKSVAFRPTVAHCDDKARKKQSS